MKPLRTSPEAPDFDEAAGLTYDQAPDYGQEAADPDYDEATIDPDYDQQADPDYDEGSQGEFADDFTEPEYEEAGQEHRPRKQK